MIGSWHQASVLCACFAELGYHVTGIADEAVVSGLIEGRAPVHEPGLDELLSRMIEAGRLRFTHSFAQGLSGAEFAFLAIDTPVGPNDESDLKPIWQAVDEIASTAPADLTLCVTSQLPVNTWHEYLGAGRIADALLERWIHNAHRFELKSRESRRKEATDLLDRGQSVK